LRSWARLLLFNFKLYKIKETKFKKKFWPKENFGPKKCLLKFVFPRMMSSIKDCLPSKIVFHQRLSSIKGCVPQKVVLNQRWPSIKVCLPSNDVLHQRVSSIKCHLTIFHQRMSSIKGCLPHCFDLTLTFP